MQQPNLSLHGTFTQLWLVKYSNAVEPCRTTVFGPCSLPTLGFQPGFVANGALFGPQLLLAKPNFVWWKSRRLGSSPISSLLPSVASSLELAESPVASQVKWSSAYIENTCVYIYICVCVYLNIIYYICYIYICVYIYMYYICIYSYNI
jgi:hypothetical protein